LASDLGGTEVTERSELPDQVFAELDRHLYWHPGKCGCGWKIDDAGDADWSLQYRMHVAQSITDSRVTPVLAAKDAELKFAEATRAQYAEERDLLLWLHAEAVWTLERLRVETDPVRIGNLVYAITGRWAGGEPVDAQVDNAVRALRADETDAEELRTERDALKAKRLWRTAPISGVMHLVPNGDGRRESICGLTASTTWRDAIDGNASCLECSRWQPVTEATTEQTCSHRPGIYCGRCIERDPEYQDHGSHKGIRAGCSYCPASEDMAEQSAVRHSVPSDTCSACRKPELADDPATPTEPRVWRKGDPEPGLDVHGIRLSNGEVFTRWLGAGGVWWMHESGALSSWRAVWERTGEFVTEVFQDGTQ
jgi:hypothetical protein